MITKAVLSALLTGAFCAVFAVCVDAILSMVGTYAVAGIAMVSGFLGSLFARLVLKEG